MNNVVRPVIITTIWFGTHIEVPNTKWQNEINRKEKKAEV
jgi:hypothetical protein